MRQPPGTAQIGDQLELGGRGQPVMQHVVEPSPFEIGRPDGLRFIAGPQHRYRSLTAPADARGQLHDHQGLQRGQILTLVDRNRVELQKFGGHISGDKSVHRLPRQVQFGEVAGRQRAWRILLQLLQYFGGGAGCRMADIAGAPLFVGSLVDVRLSRGGESPGIGRHRGAHPLRVSLVPERERAIGPGTQLALMGMQVGPKALSRVGKRDLRRGGPQQLPDESRKGGHVKMFGRRAEAVEIAARERRQIRGEGEVENARGAR